MNSTESASGGASLQARPTTWRRLAALSVLALATGVGAAGWLEVRGAVTYSGRVQSRTTAIVVPRAARLHELTVIPGQRVVPGEKLLQLADERLTTGIATKRRELVELEADLQRVKATADVELEWRRRELHSEAFQTQLKATSVTQERLSKQVEQLAWREHLTGGEAPGRFGPSLVEAALPFPPIVLDSPRLDERRLQAMLREDAAASAAETLATQLTLCEQQLERLKKLEEDLPGKIRLSAGVELAETRLTRVREELAALEQQCESLTISSPAHGVVGAVHRQPGDLVQPGDTVLELFDDDRRYLIASIPSSAVARLRPGTKLNLIFPAKQKRIGLVATIPPQAMSEDETELAEDSQVAVKIEPAGKLWPKVPVGSRVKVQVLQ